MNDINMAWEMAFLTVLMSKKTIFSNQIMVQTMTHKIVETIVKREKKTMQSNEKSERGGATSKQEVRLKWSAVSKRLLRFVESGYVKANQQHKWKQKKKK